MDGGGLIWWIVVGLIAGALAKFIMPGRDPGGIIVTILLGIVGAVLGGFLAGALGIGAGNLVMSIVIATLGAILVLFLYRMFTKNRPVV